MPEELEMDCVHCDEPFSEKYLRWHFARRKHTAELGDYSLLTCKACGLQTPVRWHQEEAA
jgi:hypothetical protein